jgi:hypothetical protein
MTPQPLLVTAATGERCRQAALALDESLRDHHWPPLLVISEWPLHSRRNATGPSPLWGGRSLKTGFAAYLPPAHTGPVVWVDADCLAHGPFPGLPDLSAAAVHGLPWGRRYLTHAGPRQFLHSTLLVFPTAALARHVSARWHAHFCQKTHPRTDEPALVRALEGIPTRALPGSHEWPLPGLWHDGAHSRLVNGRPAPTP